MHKTLLISAALVLLASPAMAFNGGDADAKAKAQAEAVAEAKAAAIAAQKQYQEQLQKQLQLQGQEQTTKLNTSDNVTVEGDDVDQEYYNVVTPSSAGNNQWECTQSYNGSLNILFGGFSFGVPVSDEVCELASLHQLAVAMNDKIGQAMASRRLRDILQDRIGYNATVLTVQQTAAPGTSVAHKARPAWCEDRDAFGMSDDDKRACGLI